MINQQEYVLVKFFSLHHCCLNLEVRTIAKQIEGMLDLLRKENQLFQEIVFIIPCHCFIPSGCDTSVRAMIPLMFDVGFLARKKFEML